MRCMSHVVFSYALYEQGLISRSSCVRVAYMTHVLHEPPSDVEYAVWAKLFVCMHCMSHILRLYGLYEPYLFFMHCMSHIISLYALYEPYSFFVWTVWAILLFWMRCMSHVVFCTCAVWAGSVEISVAPALKESRSSTFPADTRRRTCPATCPGTPAPSGMRSTPIFSTSRGLRECFYYNLFNLKTKTKSLLP